LLILDTGFLDILLEKYGANLTSSASSLGASTTRDWITAAPQSVPTSLLTELARTAGAIRAEISPRERFDERWTELCSCRQLDGYRVEDGTIVTIEPTIEGSLSLHSGRHHLTHLIHPKYRS
jgi:hypothetical protein